MNTQELIDWYKANKALMPQQPFELEEYIAVSDPATFYAKIDKDIAEYPEIFGRQRLIMHLNFLHKLVTI